MTRPPETQAPAARRDRSRLQSLAMIAVIIVVDVLFLRNRFGLRLAVNVLIIALFAVAYFRFVKRP